MQTAAVLEASDARDGRVERMQQNRLRLYRDRIGMGAGNSDGSDHHRQHDGGQRETETIVHDYQ